MSGSTSTGSRRQGVRGSGAPVTISQSEANRRLRRLMERGTPRGGGGNFTPAQMRRLATQAGFNPRRFRV